MKKTFIFIILARSLFGQYIADPVIVTASRLNTSIIYNIREAHVLKRQEISRLPVESVSGLLEYIANTDVKNRGPDGIQADFGLRGSSFEQVVIMLDGVRLNDPQTGHHNSDIPVVLADIQKIEIIPGHASSLYGSDALGGIINIITTAPLKRQTRLGVRAGSYKSISGYLSHTFQLGNSFNRFSIEKRQSDGYRFDTDYKVINSSLTSSFRKQNKLLEVQLGLTSKDFGANGFYAAFPSREKTTGYFGRIAFNSPLTSKIKLKSSLHAKKHADDFILDFQNPGLYQNKQQTEVIGADVQTNLSFGENNELALGLSTRQERLLSKGLGDHLRANYALFMESVFEINKKIILNTGVRADFQSKWGMQINPGLSMRINLTDQFIMHGSAGRAFRAPTFTELYYLSPANQGDPNLKPEISTNWEAGLIWNNSLMQAEVNVFQRFETDRIDWVAAAPGQKWEVMNIGQLDMTGISLTGSCRRINYNWRFHYSYLHPVTKGMARLISKYALNIPRHKLTWILYSNLIANFSSSLAIRYIDMERREAYTLIDIKIIRPVGSVSFSLELGNVLNTTYQEIPGLIMPGRNIKFATDWVF